MQRILVTGAAGFIGRRVTQMLLDRGYAVCAMIRNNDAATSFPAHAHLTTRIGDMRDADSLRAATRDCDAVVHLAARKNDENDSEDVNVGGAARLVAACVAANCQRLVNVSTQSAKIAIKGTYADSKSRADRIFQDSGLTVTTLLPSVVYGVDAGGVFDAISRFVSKLPVIPVLGDGRWISAPIHVDDVCDAIVASLECDAAHNRSYDLGGPDFVTFDQLIDRIASQLGRRVRKIHLPFSWSLRLARLVACLPGAAITVSNVLGSNQDTAIDIAPARRDLNFAPRTLAVGLCQVFAGSSAAHDARVLTRHLLGREPTANTIVKYADACSVLRKAGRLDDGAEWQFARNHPHLLGCIDAAAAFLNKPSPTRARCLLMAAIVETEPAYAPMYFEPPRGQLIAALQLARVGGRATIRLLVGTMLRLFARSRL